MKKNIFFAVLALCLVQAAKSGAIESGDILFMRGIPGLVDSVQGMEPIGHAALYVGPISKGGPHYVLETIPSESEKISSGMVRLATFKNFFHGRPYYGNRTTNPKPTPTQRGAIIKFGMTQIGIPYDYTHTGQKGAAGRYDCVGFTEKMYELAGINPIKDEGSIITPGQQFRRTFYNPSSDFVLRPQK